MSGYYGPDYEVEIGVTKARKLLAAKGKEVPKIGYEIDIARVDGYPLRIINISGQLYVGSHSVQIGKWAEVFNFDPASLEFITHAY